MEQTIGSRFWLWGHPLNSCRSYVDEEVEMNVTPAECARYFGLKNVYYVAFGHEMDMKVYSKDQDGISKTGLSVEKWGNPNADRIEETFKLIPLFTNLNRLVFDDFFSEYTPSADSHIFTCKSITVAQLLKIRDRIHAAGLEMWVVLYQNNLEMKADLDEYLEVFDGVSFWFWSEPTIEEYNKYSQIFIDKTPGKRRLMGCYLYDFGRRKQAVPELVRYQLDNNRKLMKQGILDGVILHNNNFGGLNFPAYEEAKKWMDEHRDEII